MGLITKEVEINCGSHIKRFENLGYEFPKYWNENNRKWMVKRGTTIKVRVADLQKGSKIRVEAECDCCGKLLSMQYCSYVDTNHDGKTYCQPCGNRLFNSGKNSNRWNFNKTDEERKIERKYPEYTEFIKRVLARDDYTCQCCGKMNRETNFEVHHLDGYEWCVEKRTDETNGITLCSDCHSNFHACYGYGGNTKEQFEEWLGKTIELMKCDVDITPAKKIYCIDNDTVYNSAIEICRELKFKSKAPIYKVCNKLEKYKSVNGYHFLWYDEYMNMTQEDINKYMDYCNENNNHTSVICLETEEIFESVADAERKYSTDDKYHSAISRACQNVGRITYYREDGLGLHWMYYDEYLTKTPEEIYEIKHTFKTKRPMICLSYSTVYKDSTEAANNCGIKIHFGSILNACKKGIGQTGILPNGNKLTWMYYDLFLDLSQEEQKRILEKYKESFATDGSFINNKNNEESEEDN